MTTKRLTAALLAVCLALLMALPVSAAGSAASLDEAVQAVTALGILSGDGSGDLALERRVSRAEFITLAIRAVPGGDGVGQAAVSPYPDVPQSHWASGYVEAGVSRGLISGYSDGTFRPNQEITLAEGAVIVLALLGYRDFSGAYPTGQMTMYRSLRLDRGVSVLQAADPITRQDAVYLFYNLLSAKTKEGAPYIQSLGYSLDAAGKPDLVELISRDLEGPVVARSGWPSDLSFTPNTVYRNGVSVPAGAVRDYDVLYWNAGMKTVWAYAKRTTGLIQAVEPSGANPVSVTVAGHTYPIETSAAAYALSDLGQYRLGDTVTLLLGRDGGVAAVTSAAAGAAERVGLALEVSTASYPDGDGGSYTAQTVALLSTDGRTYQYRALGNKVRAGSLVRASADPLTGEVVLSTLPSSTLTGKVSRDGARLGQYLFAQNAEILDVSERRGAVITPDRLAGLILSKGQVRCYTLNAQGEIETLILSDVTGDMHQYGVLTKMESMGEGMFASYSYEFDLGGVTCLIPGTTTRFPVSAGPVQIKGDPAAPDRILPLTAVKGGTVSGGQFIAGSQKYTLWEKAAVYEYRNGAYYLSSLARAEGSSGTLTAWYDKAESSGGRVRVIIIK